MPSAPQLSPGPALLHDPSSPSVFALLELVQDHTVLSDLVSRWQYYHSDHPLRFVRTAQTPAHAIRLSFSCGDATNHSQSKLPPHPSFRGTPALCSAPLFITLVGQSLEIRVPLDPRRQTLPQRSSAALSRKRRCCLRCQPAWFPEFLRICLFPPFWSLNDKRMLSDIKR